MDRDCNTHSRIAEQAARRSARDAARECAWIAEMDTEPLSTGLCYFAGNDEMVKIGFSTDADRRVDEVRREAGLDCIELFATARGGKLRESYYHQRFAEHRTRGEWFALHPDIVAEIERLNGQTFRRRDVRDAFAGGAA